MDAEERDDDRFLDAADDEQKDGDDSGKRAGDDAGGSPLAFALGAVLALVAVYCFSNLFVIPWLSVAPTIPRDAQSRMREELVTKLLGSQDWSEELETRARLELSNDEGIAIVLRELRQTEGSVTRDLCFKILSNLEHQNQDLAMYLLGCLQAITRHQAHEQLVSTEADYFFTKGCEVLRETGIGDQKVVNELSGFLAGMPAESSFRKPTVEALARLAQTNTAALEALQQRRQALYAELASAINYRQVLANLPPTSAERSRALKYQHRILLRLILSELIRLDGDNPEYQLEKLVLEQQIELIEPVL